MKYEISMEIFVALREQLPLEHFAFSSPMPEHGWKDRKEHFKGPRDLFVDVVCSDDHVGYWIFLGTQEDQR